MADKIEEENAAAEVGSKMKEFVIDPVDGKNFRWLEGGVQTLYLGGQTLWLKLEGKIEEQCEDKELPWEPRSMKYHQFMLKQFVAGCNCYLSSSTDLWKVEILFRGAEDWPIFFKDEVAASALQHDILKWILIGAT